jgi:hypothetical protein
MVDTGGRFGFLAATRKRNSPRSTKQLMPHQAFSSRNWVVGSFSVLTSKIPRMESSLKRESV